MAQKVDYISARAEGTDFVGHTSAPEQVLISSSFAKNRYMVSGRQSVGVGSATCLGSGDCLYCDPSFLPGCGL